MRVEVWGMTGVGVAVLGAGLVLAGPRLRAASGVGKILVLGPVFEAVALAMFAAEHFTAARDLMGLVPGWLPGPLFWVYFVGAGLAAAAVSFVADRCVRWAALALALFFLLVVALLDLPNVAAGMHDRFFWILTVRETCFAAGALVLAGSTWPQNQALGCVLRGVGRRVVGAVVVFYAVEHFLHPRHVPGVPLEKLTPAWVPAPMVLACFVGLVLLVGGVGLFCSKTARLAAAGAGTVLVLLTAFFYLPILLMEFHTPLAVEGLNYVGDTLLFAATVMLAGLGAEGKTGSAPA
jgi:uncharacterized membrane protein